MPSATNIDGEGEAEEQRRAEHLGRAAALLDVGERDARDRRQVAGHERQHAGRDERDEADGEGGEDGGVDVGRRRSQVVALDVRVEPAAAGPAAAGGRGAAVAAAGPRQRSDGEADPAEREHDRRAPGSRRRARRRGRRRRSSPGSASTPSPNWATSARLISSLERQSAISRSMKARCAAACGASVARPSGVPQTGHITSSSTSPRVVLRAVRGRRRGRRASSASDGDAAPRRASRALPSSGATCSRMNSLVHRAAATAAMRPCAVDHEGLRVARRRRSARAVAVAVAEHRVAEAVLARRSRARRRSRRARRRRARCRPASRVRSCQRWSSGDSSRHGLAPGGPEVEDHDLAAVVGERAARRRPTAAAARASGAGSRCRARAPRSMPRSGSLLASPYASSATSATSDADDGDRNGAREPPHERSEG